MLVIYFENGSAIIREQGLYFKVITTKCDYLLVKSTNLQYVGLEAKMEKSKTTLFPQTFEVAEN